MSRSVTMDASDITEVALEVSGDESADPQSDLGALGTMKLHAPQKSVGQYKPILGQEFLS